MKLENWLWWVLINGGLVGAVWCGFIEGVQGAQYLVQFVIWAMYVPLALASFTDSLQSSLAKGRAAPVRSFLTRVIAWAVLVILILQGYVATAVAWAFWMCAREICLSAAMRKRCKSAARDAAERGAA
jgi:hypothetical protein